MTPAARTAFFEGMREVMSDPAMREELRALLLDEPDRDPAPAEDGWMDTTQAAEYLGQTPNAVHKLTAGRLIPFEQEGPGCKCWFRRSQLDRWRAAGGASAASKPHPRHTQTA